MVYSAEFYVGFSDVNPDLGLSNASALRLFENVCCMQGEAVGDGFKDTPGRWFVTAYHVIIFNRPKYNDIVTVSTWSREAKGVAASREFEIRDKSGKLLAAALSNWARMNTETGRLERMSPEAFARYESEPQRHYFDDPWLQKMREGGETLYTRKYTVGRSLIDPNRHMNNVKYLDIAAESLPDNAYGTGEADEFEITYRKAVPYGKTLVCEYSEDDTARFVTMRTDDEVNAVVKLYK